MSTITAPAPGVVEADSWSRDRVPSTLWVLEGSGEVVAVTLDGDLDSPHAPCRRCGGSGSFSWNEADGDRCFGCDGHGDGDSTTWAKAVANAKARIARREREARKAREAMERAARERVEGIVSLQTREPEVAQALSAAHARVVVRDLVSYFGSLRPFEEWASDFGLAPRGLLEDVAVSWYSTGRISERQVEAVRKVTTERASIPPVPVGRVEVEGEVRSTKPVESDYGTTWKMLVALDSGAKVWGSIPSAIDPEVGDRVRFTATIEPSQDDASFGFYKRPTKASVLPA